MSEVELFLKELNDSFDGLTENIQQTNEFAMSIKTITEQTNLLALNASIEAARAGEHGHVLQLLRMRLENLRV